MFERKKIFPYIFILLISISLFVFFTGGEIIFLQNVDWILPDDSRYHYLNWLFFQNTPFFQFPIFKNFSYGMEFSSKDKSRRRIAGKNL